MRRIVIRVLAAVPAVAIQFAWVAAVGPLAGPVGGVAQLCPFGAGAAVCFVPCHQADETAYSMLWLLVILSFPLPGAFLYLLFGDKRTTRKLRRQLDRVGADFPPAPPAAPPGAPPRLAQTFAYLEDITGAALQPNAFARFYPLGDDIYPVMLQALEQAKRFIFIEYFIIDRGVLWDSFVEIFAPQGRRGRRRPRSVRRPWQHFDLQRRRHLAAAAAGHPLRGV